MTALLAVFGVPLVLGLAAVTCWGIISGWVAWDQENQWDFAFRNLRPAPGAAWLAAADGEDVADLLHTELIQRADRMLAGAPALRE